MGKSIELQEVTLESLRGGAAVELWQHCWEKLVRNVLDIDTDPKAKRSVVLKVEVKPAEDRGEAVVKVSAEAKLAPPRANAGTVHFGKGRDGKPVAVDFDPAQRDMFDPERGSGITPIDVRRRAAGDDDGGSE